MAEEERKGRRGSLSRRRVDGAPHGQLRSAYVGADSVVRRSRQFRAHEHEQLVGESARHGTLVARSQGG